MINPTDKIPNTTVYVVQKSDLADLTKEYFRNITAEYPYFNGFDFKFTPDEIYDIGLYQQDLNLLKQGHLSLASITDSRGINGFENEPVRILLRDDFFISHQDPMDIFFHEFGHYHTNLIPSLVEIRSFSIENYPPFFYTNNSFDDIKVFDKINFLNEGIVGLMNIVKLPQEVHAQLWVYDNYPERFYSFMESYFNYLDSLFESLKSKDIVAEDIYLKLPQFVYVLYWLEAVSKNVSEEYYSKCLSHTTKVYDKFINLFSETKYKDTQLLELKTSILSLIEYRKESTLGLFRIYESMFKEFLVKAATCFGSNFTLRIEIMAYYGNYLRILTERLNTNEDKKQGSVWDAIDLPKKEIDIFKSIVIEAGEVSSKSFDGLIKKNPILCFYPSITSTQGVGALKVPNDKYKDRVFQSAGFANISKYYSFELGWIVCIEKYRGNGIGKKISQLLSSNPDLSIYATVRETNSKMLKILEDLDFKKLGDPFGSTRGDYKIQLLVNRILK